VFIWLGSRHKKTPASLGIMARVYFGRFQALIPLVGYLRGIAVILIGLKIVLA
jgi:hypothetical protein